MEIIDSISYEYTHLQVSIYSYWSLYVHNVTRIRFHVEKVCYYARLFTNFFYPWRYYFQTKCLIKWYSTFYMFFNLYVGEKKKFELKRRKYHYINKILRDF